MDTLLSSLQFEEDNQKKMNAYVCENNVAFTTKTKSSAKWKRKQKAKKDINELNKSLKCHFCA